jgi:hypothetical protein
MFLRNVGKLVETTQRHIPKDITLHFKLSLVKVQVEVPVLN